jgi:hypothetical protein
MPDAKPIKEQVELCDSRQDLSSTLWLISLKTSVKRIAEEIL